VTSLISGLEQIADRFVTGLQARLAAISNAGADFDGLQAAFAAAETSLFTLFLEAVVVAALVAGVFLLLVRRFGHKATSGRLWLRALAVAAAIVLSLAVGLIAARMLAEPGLPRQTLRLWSLGAVIGCTALAVIRSILFASRPAVAPHRSAQLAALVNDLSVPIAWGVFGLAAVATLRLWNAGLGLVDLVRTGLVAIPVFVFLSAAVWRRRRQLAAIVAGKRPRSGFRSRLSKSWPGIIIGFLILTLVATQAALTFGRPLPGLAVLVTLLVVFATPSLDAMIHGWAQRGLVSPGTSIPAAAAQQTARFTVVAAMIALLGTLWAAPVAAGLGFDLWTVARDALGVALIALAAAFLWNVVGTVANRALRAQVSGSHHDEEMGAPRSRLGTLVPLLSAVAKSGILALALLSMLVSIGVNVWPLITGLSIFGLAIGFGSQALVKDIVSGLFFLIDDAFRMGEYIETSGAKGTVEKISVRSVSLRHPRGALASVPYGQIGKIQNFSRDWAIEKLVFRVALDTDIDKVKKLFKKIGQDLAADPELAPDLLEPFKSQGIAEVEDGTLLIRGKFKAKAGRQFMIKRTALAAVHKAFRENGIQAVPKPITSAPEAPAAA
jgi:small-conductance mechanosensitive channel